jgi:hypothetical protein
MSPVLTIEEIVCGHRNDDHSLSAAKYYTAYKVVLTARLYYSAAEPLFFAR